MTKSKRDREPKWQYHIKRLIKFLGERGWSVLLGNVKTDICEFSTKRICVRTIGRRPEITLYILLHEAGHVLFSKRSGDYLEYAQELNIGRNSMSYKVLEVEEEFEAWKHGYDLAFNLKIPIDKKGYEVIKSRYLATYMMNAMNSKVKFEIRNGIKEDRERRLNAPKLIANNQNLSQVNESQVLSNGANERKEIQNNKEK
jgi:hypothetical protein